MPPAAFSIFLKFHGAGADVLQAMGNAEEGIVSASLLERGYGWRLCCQFLSHTITSYLFVTNISVEIAPSLRCSWIDHSWIPQLGANISIFIVVETRCCSSAWRSHVTYLTFGSNCGPQLWRSCDICLAECGVYSSKHPAFCRSPAVTYFTLVADVTGYRSFAAYMERLALM